MRYSNSLLNIISDRSVESSMTLYNIIYVEVGLSNKYAPIACGRGEIWLALVDFTVKIEDPSCTTNGPLPITW